jgi:inosine-uridine nucleoside N-ribohydrolase
MRYCDYSISIIITPVQTYKKELKMQTDLNIFFQTNIPHIYMEMDFADDDQLAALITTLTKRLKLITGVDNGLAHGKQGAENMISLLAYLNYPSIEVAYSTHPPLKGKVGFPEAWRENVDKLSSMPFSETGRKAPTSNAVELLRSRLKESTEKIRVLCNGSTH